MESLSYDLTIIFLLWFEKLENITFPVN